jgi:hypothetical protein
VARFPLRSARAWRSRRSIIFDPPQPRISRLPRRCRCAGDVFVDTCDLLRTLLGASQPRPRKVLRTIAFGKGVECRFCRQDQKGRQQPSDSTAPPSTESVLHLFASAFHVGLELITHTPIFEAAVTSRAADGFLRFATELLYLVSEFAGRTHASPPLVLRSGTRKGHRPTPSRPLGRGIGASRTLRDPAHIAQTSYYLSGRVIGAGVK